MPSVIPECGCYIMYIGMASKTKKHNLRARIRAYKKQFSNEYDRDRLHNLFVRWGRFVYVYYLPLKSSTEVIQEVETRLIACFVPPCNSDIRDPVVKRGIKAFASY